ncbi:hypothetical protein Pflav_052610 [Phytohabitans flavus]|uniref:NB-ARC domain-containing protein n=1 Tax=Phytohabitans flavus TaxID=1076124 RepID=A0A6F8XYP1_9ACTN|nr:tetratricopeptide repeat protein [Phytohabitans flavus]BCB78851.1 hypothetical protein Pflav_052610 [Phytohabitans flavus]
MTGPAGIFNAPVNVGGAGRPVVSFPHQVGAVPRLAHGRQPRPADGLLATAVGGGGTTVVCQVLAGMGGVGKTQLAANLATQLWQTGQLDLLVWVTASSRTTILDTYSRAAADLTGVEDQDPQHAADRLRAWLAATGRRWLVVLDDITHPTDLTGLWPPDTATGRTVATTRRRDTALLAGRRLIDVGVFTTAEAHAYLIGQLGDTNNRLDEADELAGDLGYLPIALAQAAAYILDRDLTCAAYRTRLHRRRLDRLHPDTLPDEQQQTVTETWALSIIQADAATDHLAGQILRLAALLDANGIPTDLFTTTAALDYYRHTLGPDVDADAAADATRALYRLGLADATRDPDTGITLVRVHALVQRVVTEATPDDQRQAFAHAAADAIMELWPDIEHDSLTARLGRLLRTNTTALTVAVGDHLWHSCQGELDAHVLLYRAGDSQGEIGQVVAARNHYQQLAADAAQILGPDHPDTLRIRHNLAYWRGKAGDAAGAVQAFEEVLADQLRLVSPDHPDTLTTRSNLAYWRGEAGDAAGAAEAFEEMLADRLRVLGSDHPDTLRTRHNIAGWRAEAGDAAGAVQAFEEVLAGRLRVLGSDHPDTLRTRHNIAAWRGRRGTRPALPRR